MLQDRHSGIRAKLAIAAGTLATVVVSMLTMAPPAQAAECDDVTRYTTAISGSNFILRHVTFRIPGYGTTCTLRYGDSGAGVSALQRSLRTCFEKDYVVVDGVFGPRTRDALRSAQSFLGVDVDGVYGYNTRSAMKHYGEDYDGMRICGYVFDGRRAYHV